MLLWKRWELILKHKGEEDWAKVQTDPHLAPRIHFPELEAFYRALDKVNPETL